MESSSEDLKIKRLSGREILNSFYNKHFEEFISSMINMDIWKEKTDVNATAYFEPMKSINSQGGIQETQRRVTISEAIEREEYRFYAQQNILLAIKKLDKINLEDEIGKELKPKFAKLKK